VPVMLADTDATNMIERPGTFAGATTIAGEVLRAASPARRLHFHYSDSQQIWWESECLTRPFVNRRCTGRAYFESSKPPIR
jgi:hypothetical protein